MRDLAGEFGRTFLKGQTAAAALFAAGLFPDLGVAEAEAGRLWATRPRSQAA